MAAKLDLGALVLPRDISPYGGKFPFWELNVKTIESFIASQGLKPATVGLQVPGVRIPPSKFPGIPAITHLHFKGKIYLLDKPQWTAFSQQVVADARAKLAAVNEVSFERAMVLGSLAQSL